MLKDVATLAAEWRLRAKELYDTDPERALQLEECADELEEEVNNNE